ncbi:MAG TPA: SEFIR domain-containing protein [Pseudonocardiaceae bacterium]|jgi:hypothetical protein|nr:SEFIR domain-containing protein [Pseudonocardiaceae bacterium]
MSANSAQPGLKPPRVFISYSHDTPEHKKLVGEFATVLRTQFGIDVRMDQWYEDRQQDWAKWAIHQLDEADFVLAVVSPNFRDRIDGRAPWDEGRGAQFEGALLRSRLTKDQQTWVRRILPIVLPGCSTEDIPDLLFPYTVTHYIVESFTPEGLMDVRRALAGNFEPTLPNLGPCLVPEPQSFANGDRSSATGSGGLGGAVLLTSLSPASRGGDIRFRSAEINGRHFGDSIIYRCDLFCQQPRGVVEFSLGRKYRRFEAIAGVLDDAADSGQTGQFQVFTDGTVRARGEAHLGRAVRFQVDVTGVLRLRLVAYRPDTIASPLMIGALATSGKSGNMPELAWGDPILRP